MGYFKLFSKAATTSPAKTEKPASEISTSSRSQDRGSVRTTSSSGSKSRASRRSKGSKNKVVVKSERLKTAEELIDRINNFRSEEHLLALFVNPDETAIAFEDGFEITPRQWAESLANTHASFPNMKFDYDFIKETSSTAVVIENLQFTGTHTGAPFTFAPRFPAIPAVGVHVVNDEERLIVKTQDGKIQTCKVVSLGVHTGPPGAYEQIGGSLVPAP